MSISSAEVNKKAVSIWRNQSFLILLSSTFLLSIANRIYELLLPLILLELTNSSVAVTTMRTAELLPNLLFGIFIGVFVDRSNKKKLALWAIGLQAGLLLCLTWMLKIETGWLVPYYAIGFLLMTCNYGYFNTQVGLVKMNIPTHYLNSANAKFSFIETFVSVMGPVISGMILLLPVFYNGVLITALAYVICFVILSRLSHQPETPRQANSGFLADFREGWKAFRENKALGMMTMFIMVLNSTMIVVQTIVVIFAKKDLDLAASEVALVMGAAGIGGMAGSLLCSKLRETWGLGVLFGASTILYAAAYWMMYITNNYHMLIIALFLSGMATSFYSVCAYTFRLEQTPPDLIGRISGITGTFFRVGMPIAVYASGWVMAEWGAAPIFLMACIVNLIVFVIYRTTFLWKLK